MESTELNRDQVSRISRALADETRAQLLAGIFAKGVSTCGEASSDLDVKASTASHHIHELLNADLVTVTRKGRRRLLTPHHSVWRAYIAYLKSF